VLNKCIVLYCIVSLFYSLASVGERGGDLEFDAFIRDGNVFLHEVTPLVNLNLVFFMHVEQVHIEQLEPALPSAD